MTGATITVTAPQQAPQASERELIETASKAVSGCAWVVGRCAAEWCRLFAVGRSDGDFGAAIGLSADQIFARRRVWETFADVRDQYRNLKWSHFFVSLTWDDAPECLAWADENEATVAEMKAWRRLQHGEDLTVPSGEAPDYSGASERDAVTDDSELGHDASPAASHSRARDVTPSTMATLGEHDPAESFSPFKTGGSAAAPREDNGDGAGRDAVLLRRTCNTVSRAIKLADDSEQLVSELLSACWREDADGTIRALVEFGRAHSTELRGSNG